MKRCPKCQRTYPDDSPGFCVNDGAQLVTEAAQSYDPQKTMLASAPPPPPPPPQQYSTPQPPPPPQSPPQPVWPPPSPQQQQQQQQQQGQNWGGGYYQQPGQTPSYGTPYAAQAGTSNKLSLTALILGSLSGLLGFLLLADYLGWMRMFTRDSGQVTIIAAVATGAIALVLGIMALISARQRSKPLAIVGMILSAASIAFYIYLEVEYGLFFS